MSALDRKALRDLVRLWAQALAIAAVLACGVMVLVLGTGTRASLKLSRATYYERNRFADVFVSATRVPRTELAGLAAIPGIARLSPSIRSSALIDLPRQSAPITATVISLPADGAPPALNAPLLIAGRLPDPRVPGEVALYAPFAEAHRLIPGDGFDAVIKGQKRHLTVTGHVLSPEFIYTVGPGSLMPDEERFGVLWIGEAEAEAAADLKDAFNTLDVGLARDATEPAVIAALDAALARWGGTGAHGRSEQFSHAFLQSELDQLGAMALILPPIFLAVSAFLVNMVLGRLIALERGQIGLLKAVGYTTPAIAGHYLKFALGIGLLGTAIGWVAGWYLGAAMTQMYTRFYRLPFLVYAPSSWPFALSALLALATTLAGAGRAVAASVRLPPAEAMRPPTPPAYHRGRVERVIAPLHLRQTTLMILRGLARTPGRAAITLFGVTASVAVLVASFFTFDTMGAMIDEIFTRANRQNVTLILSADAPARAVTDARALPGVIAAEGSYVLPVRLRHGTRTELTSLSAHDPVPSLARLIDAEGAAVPLPPEGLVLPESLARKLALVPGDTVTVEALAPPRETWEIPLTATVAQSLGQEAHIAAPALFARMRVAPQVNRIDLRTDPAEATRLDAAVKATPAIAGTIDWHRTRALFEATIHENLAISTLIYSALGMLITLGVIYNAARIQLSERAHELASLRVLGLSRGEVGYVLVGEIALLTLIALPLGCLAGYGFAALVAKGFSTDIIALPLVISRATYARASLIVLATALGAALTVRRRLDRIDIAAALKARE